MDVQSSKIELNSEDCHVTVKNPKRILHFSDGTLEEYSDSEEQEQSSSKNDNVVDTSTMRWGPWLVHKALSTGNATLAACDYVGEAMASFLGITTPKYQYELDEYKRLERERQATSDENSSNGWVNTQLNSNVITTHTIEQSRPLTKESN